MDEQTNVGSTKKPALKSSILKCGKRTYFFDLRLAANNSKYLTVTESSFIKDSQDRKRNTFLLFANDIQNFQNKLSELTADLS